jgi:hypothetical protein
MEDKKDNVEKTRNSKRNYWKKEEEDLLKEWADKAQCYKWMHLKSHEKYRSKNAWFTIPVIIISTFTGTANFAQDRFPESNKSTIVMAIGSLNIIAGIITTIYQFLKISEFNEAHRVASLSWDKFYRNLKTELTKNPLDRFSPYEMIKISKEEYDRLVEISPLIPNDVIMKFNATFKKNKAVIRPDLCGELNSTSVYELSEDERTMLYTTPEEKKVENPEVKTNKKIINKRLEKFRNTFFQLNQRYPTENEIKNKFNTIYDQNDYEDVSKDVFEDENIRQTISKKDSSSSSNDSLNSIDNPSSSGDNDNTGDDNGDDGNEGGDGNDDNGENDNTGDAGGNVILENSASNVTTI